MLTYAQEAAPQLEATPLASEVALQISKLAHMHACVHTHVGLVVSPDAINSLPIHQGSHVKDANTSSVTPRRRTIEIHCDHTKSFLCHKKVFSGAVQKACGQQYEPSTVRPSSPERALSRSPQAD